MRARIVALMATLAPVMKAVAAVVAVVAAAVAPALVLAPGSADALAPPTPWNGANPFRCTIQDAGQGTTVPDPGAARASPWPS